MLKTEHKIIIGNSERMSELEDKSVHLMVTSPPYPMIEIWDDLFARLDAKIAERWRDLKAESAEENKERIVVEIYGLMHENLAKVWKEVYRVLVDGGIACINIGDATRTVNSRFRLFPNHSKVIEHCEKIGFSALPHLLWKKPTTKPKYKGKGAFLGSGFLPPNAYVTLDCEYILIFRKGGLRKFDRHDPRRYQSAFTKEERDFWFTQIWDIVGTKQTESEIERRIAAFPEEVVYRLIRMFSIKGDVVLDPFLGSGTTTKVAIDCERNSVGYEVDEALLPLIKRKINFEQAALTELPWKVSVIKRDDRMKSEEKASSTAITQIIPKREILIPEREAISEMKPLNEFEHTLKKWEKTRGFLGHGDKWLSFFSGVFDKPFTLNIDGRDLPNRRIDKFGRIYVGKRVWEDFQIGEQLICLKDSSGNYSIKRKNKCVINGI
ncbi:MAG: site-specific DNA-methyltransferase [Candidatus Bathyarchaeia archaeon]